MEENTQTLRLQLEHIRLHQVLGIQDKFSEEIKFFMPQEQGGSLNVIESMVHRRISCDFLLA